MRQSEFSFKFQGVAATLAVTIALSPCAAAAAPSAVGRGGAEFRVSIGLPAGGRLDAIRSVNEFIARPEIAGLLAVRNVVVEDALRTRVGLRELLNRPNLDFRVPSEVKDLYFRASEPGLELGTITDLARALEMPSRGAANRVTRQRLVAGLLFYSAQIVQAERVLRFLSEEYFTHPAIRARFRSEVLAPYLAALRPTVEDRRFVDLELEARKLWMREQGVTQQIEEWAGLREALLSRYPVLALQDEGQPLYWRLYRSSERLGLAPAASAPLAPVRAELPKRAEGIEIPSAQLDRDLRFAREAVASAEPGEYAKANPAMIEALLPALSPAIEGALIGALDANTALLKDLASERDPELGPKSLSFRLSAHESLRKQARERYSYLAPLIDFDRADQVISARHEAIRARRQKVEIALWGGGAALAVLAAATGVGALGVEGMLLGVAAESIGFVSSGLFAAHSVYRYADSRNVARIGQQLFAGKLVSPVITAAEYRDIELRSQEDFRDMVVFGALMGFMPTLGALMRSSEAVVAGGARMVKSSRAAMGSLRARVAGLSEGEIRFAAPGGRAMRTRLRAVTGVSDPAQAKVVTLDEAVAETARMTGEPVSGIWAKLKDFNAIEKFRRSWNARDAAMAAASGGRQGQLGKFMLSEQVAGFVLDTGADLKVRGLPQNADSWRKLGVHVATGALVNFMIVWRIAGIRKIELPVNPSRVDRVKHWDALFRQNSVTLFTTGAMAGGGVTAVEEAFRHFADPASRTWEQSAKSVAVNGTYWASYMGVSSALRYGFVVSPVNNGINRMLQKRAEALAKSGATASAVERAASKVALWPVSMTNGFFGSWMWVKGADFLQIQGGDAQAAAELEASDGVWITLDRGAGGAAEIFDFLPSAAPAPILVTAS